MYINIKKTAPSYLILCLVFNLFAVVLMSQTVEAIVSDAASSAIIDKYIQASGGEALKALKTEYRIGTLVRGQTGKVPLEIFAKAPNKWRYNQIFAWGDQINFGFDGLSAWEADTGGITQMDPRQAFDFKLMFGIAMPLKISELFSRMKIKGIDTIGEKAADVILADSPEGNTSELAFDKETGLLLRAGSIYFEDYRQTGDVVLPYRISLGTVEGENPNLVMEFKNIAHNDDIDDSLFERPSCDLELAAPPLHKDRITADIDPSVLTPLLGVYRHPSDTAVTFTVSMQGDHLMIGRTGTGQKIELKPESETDFYIKFPDQEFHFLKDATGKITHLIYGPDSTRAGARIQ